MMSDYKYIIVGGGMAADSAVAGIRENDPTGTIALFSKEGDPPYNRPPLSKGLWKGDEIESIFRKTGERGTEIHPSTRIVSIDPAGKTVKSSDGKSYTYTKLLLATGGSPKKLPISDPDVIYFRTLDDYRKLREISESASDCVVVGGGFIGSEIAAALTLNGKKVTMIIPESGIGARVFPKGLSTFLVGYYTEKGVNVRTGDTVVSIRKEGAKSVVGTKNGLEITADAVVAGIGITPDEEIAESAGIAVDNGIIVDAFLRTTNHDIYAAGDAANFYNPSLDRRMRVEHEDNANTTGTLAGRNMSGKPEAYNYLPFFYSDLFDLGYEAVGELDPRNELAEDWVEEYKKGVVYYLREGNVRGVLLWNTWGKVDEARKLIASKKKHSKESLKGLIRD